MPSMMAKIEPLDLTLGVEMECFLLEDNPTLVAMDKYRNLPQEERIANEANEVGCSNVIQALSQPLTAICRTCQESHQFEIAGGLNPLVTSAAHQRKIDPAFSRWTVTADSQEFTESEKAILDKHSKTQENTRRSCVEIISRVLSTRCNAKTQEHDNYLSKHEHEITYQEEIKSVCQRLQDSFNSSDSPKDIRLIANPGCGLHVHIGNVRKCFPLQTVKNLLKLAITFEMAMDTLQSVNRISGSALAVTETQEIEKWKDLCPTSMHAECYNRPWSAHMACSAYLQGTDDGYEYDAYRGVDDEFKMYPETRFADHEGLEAASKAYDIKSWLTVIDRAQSIEELQQLQGKLSHTSTLDIGGLLDFDPSGLQHADSKRKTTLEFRQHAGTVDAEEILNWIDVLLCLVRFAHASSPESISAICAKNWANFAFDGRDLLALIGCSQPVIAFYQGVMGSTTADRMCARETAVFAATDPSPFVHELCSHIVEEQAAAMQPKAVMERITEKFLRGGYGQFPEGYLGGLSVTESEKERLTVGWRRPTVEAEVEVDEC